MKILFVFNHGEIVGGGEISFIRLISSFLSLKHTSSTKNFHFGIYIPSVVEERHKKHGRVLGAMSSIFEKKRVKFRIIGDEKRIEDRRMDKPGKYSGAIPIFSFPLYPIKLGFSRTLINFVKTIYRFSPDIVHVNGTRAMIYVAIAKLLVMRRKRRPKCIWHVRVRTKDFIDPFLCLLSDALAVNSQKTARRFQGTKRKLCGEKIWVIYNGVELSLGKKVSEMKKVGHDRRIKERLGIPNYAKVVSSAGRIEDGKGFDEFFRSAFILQKIVKGRKKIFFLIAGEGPMKDKLAYLARREGLYNFILPGYMKAEEIFSVSDVFVFPSFIDGFGNLALESMVCGVPAVVSSLAGVSEIIEDGKDAFVVNPKYVKEMAYATFKLISDEKLKDKIVKNAFEKAKKFSIEEHRNKIFNLYLDLLGEKRNGS